MLSYVNVACLAYMNSVEHHACLPRPLPVSCYTDFPQRCWLPGASGLAFPHSYLGLCCACRISIVAAHTLIADSAAGLQALASLNCLDESESKQSMEGMVSYVLDRLY